MQVSDRIGRRIKLQDLHVLMTVVQARSMGKAAQLLNTTQPNVSRTIAELEHALGVRLLDRNRQGVEPTDYGRAFLDGSIAVFDELRQAVKSIEYLADPTSGEVRIGCQPFLAGSFVSTIINLSRRYPRMVFHVLDTDARTLDRELHERNLDFFIARRYRTPADESLGFEALYDDPLVIAAGRRNPLLRRRGVKLAELVNEPWALPAKENAFGAIIAEAFRVNGLEYPRITVVTGHNELRESLLATGRFLTIFAKSLFGFETDYLGSRLRIAVVKTDRDRPARAELGLHGFGGRSGRTQAMLAPGTGNGNGVSGADMSNHGPWQLALRAVWQSASLAFLVQCSPADSHASLPRTRDASFQYCLPDHAK
jgi:DNA-binding transcriptional LysR family regulator